MLLRHLLLLSFTLFTFSCSQEESQESATAEQAVESSGYDVLDATVRDFNDDNEIHAMVQDVFSAEVAAANMRGDIAILGRPLRIVIEDGKSSLKGLEMSSDELHSSYHNAVEALIVKAKKEDGGELSADEMLLLTQ